VIIFSWNTEPKLVEMSIQRGASGFVAKSVAADELVTAIEAVADGRIVLPRDLPAEAGATPQGGYPGRDAGLTYREAEIIALVTQGLSNQEIAERSYLSINSIKTYIRSAYQKMGVTRRSQAVLWGVQHGMQPDVMRQINSTPE